MPLMDLVFHCRGGMSSVLSTEWAAEYPEGQCDHWDCSYVGWLTMSSAAEVGRAA